MAESDLSISQLPPLTLPVQGSDLLHIARGGEDYRISRSELVKMLLSQLADANISGTTNGQSLVYNSAVGKWENSFISWATITGKPSTFTPIQHTHIWDEIADAPTEFTPASHTHLWADLVDAPSAFPPAVHSHDWGDLIGVPATFPPDSHTHLWAEITDKPTVFPADVHVHSWSEITGRPTEFPAEAHTHADLYYSKIELNISGAGGQVHWDNITSKPALGSGDVDWSDITNIPTDFPPSAHTHDDRYFTETELTSSGGGGTVHWDNVTNKPEVFGSGDMSKSVYDLDNDGVVDAAASIPWSGITGVPATFPSDPHNHDDRYFTETELSTSGAGGTVHWDNVTNKPALGGGGDMTKAVYDLNDDGIVDAAACVPWSGITGKPATFTPSTHSHDHRTLSYVGSNTHEAIDQHISSPAPHSGHAYTNHWHDTRQVLVHHINSATVAAGATQYITLSIPGYTGMNGVVWPIPGDMLNLVVRTNSAQPSSGSLVFTLQKGLVDTDVIATVPAGASASTQWTSGSNSEPFLSGHLLSIKVRNNATTASCAITTVSWEFRPQTV